jgi:hypothetical protein
MHPLLERVPTGQGGQMRRRSHLLLALLLLGLTAVVPVSTAGAKARTIPFADARLKIELNATDGDAGLQVFLDGESWRAVSLYNPSGHKLVEITAKGPLKDYGLTELFSESSEPSFDVFPFEEFKQLFPEGVYTFRGTTIDGKTLLSTARLTHDVPDGPRIVRPRNDAQVSRNNVVVAWKPVRTPPGIDIVGYQVVVTREEPLRVLSVDLPASARRLPVPAEFLQRGIEYKAEVLAVEASGNQTLTEVAFTVK